MPAYAIDVIAPASEKLNTFLISFNLSRKLIPKLLFSSEPSHVFSTKLLEWPEHCEVRMDFSNCKISDVNIHISFTFAVLDEKFVNISLVSPNPELFAPNCHNHH